MRVPCILFALSIFLLPLSGCDSYEDAYEAGVKQAEHVLAESAERDAVNEHISSLQPLESVGRYRIAGSDYVEFFRCRATDIMYVCFDGYRGAGLTIMRAADGSPLLYSQWISTLESLTNDP